MNKHEPNWRMKVEINCSDLEPHQLWTELMWIMLLIFFFNTCARFQTCFLLFFFPSLLVRVVCVGSSATSRPGRGKTANSVVHVHLFKTEQLSGLFRTSSTDRCKTDKCSSCIIACPNPRSPLTSHNFHLKWLPQTSCSLQKSHCTQPHPRAAPQPCCRMRVTHAPQRGH